MEQAVTLTELLEHFRESAQTEREKGTYFERLCIDFLKHDPLHGAEFEDVWSFQDWAKTHNVRANDKGIDLVASIRGEDTFCAIQCKFYAADYRIQKSDLDSFLTASESKFFSRRLFVETTQGEWGKNAEDTLDDLHIPLNRINLTQMNESSIDWSIYFKDQKVVKRKKKTLFDHQKKALEAVRDGLAEADRGKLIMACGTGKTFTSLRIAESMAGKGGRVLFLVPSLSLMSQTVREWTNDSNIELRAFAACSDVQVGKRKGDDAGDIEIHDLELPATTKSDQLAKIANLPAPERMTVVFSTYHSIEVISQAQKKHGLGEFDLIVCDEAHRTTGATLAGEHESNFVKIHNSDFINGAKRLYMTATPKIFGDNVKSKAKDADAALVSMDDEELYGHTLFTRGFSWAVENDFLTDYKVIVLAVDEAVVSAGVQRRLSDENSQLVLDDATKIIGCYKALLKTDLAEDLAFDPDPMKRALAFCKDIRSSKLIKNEFANVVEEYVENLSEEEREKNGLNCAVDHVDGTYNAKERNKLLDWLKSSETENNSCRILSNARCLSEGVDVPALDAIMFLHPRKSVIDVVQSVGRVMRRAEGKKRGYVILPVGIPAGMSPAEALNENEPYKVVWQLLNALRAHDDRFDSTINRIEFGEDVSSHIEVVAVTQDLPSKPKEKNTGPNIGEGGGGVEEPSQAPIKDTPFQRDMFIDEFAKAIMAKIVKKCGTRSYWEDWAKDVAKIAQTHITRITTIVEKEGTPERKAFDEFLEEIRDDLNESVSREESIEMLAQHLITQPVFEALFNDYSFAKNNTVSLAMQSVLDVLQPQNLQKETESLESFYDSVRQRVQGIETDEARQKIIKDLYDKFFKTAFPMLSQRMGIVYTPIEVVDFIIHSVNDVLKSEFGETLGSKGVHILDPFTGTGTFITRLLQSGLITKSEMAYKYKNEIHANEILLLAYYIATINIEATYHGIMEGNYIPFEGICLTDTFAMYENKDLIARLMPDNSERRKRQKELDIKVIIGNPPYSAGQKSANDNAGNVSYPELDQKIRDTYVAWTKVTNKKSIYDNYIRAFRWASDRIGERGVFSFVSGSAWVERAFADGMRKSLFEEFDKIYVLHLRGDIRKNMLSKGLAGEGENIFGSGSMTGTAISLLLKSGNPDSDKHIKFIDIGSNVNRSEKLEKVKLWKSFTDITEFRKIVPDDANDWLDQRDQSFDKFPIIGSKRGKEKATVFNLYSSGLKTQRDAWCYNFSKVGLTRNISQAISFFNGQADEYKKSGSQSKPEQFVDNDPKKFKWCQRTFRFLAQNIALSLDEKSVTQSIYRPFTKQLAYYNRDLNWSAYLQDRIFPKESAQPNRYIAISGVGNRSGFSCLMSDILPAYDFIEKGQCFPLMQVSKATEESKSDLFQNENKTGLTSAINETYLTYFRGVYRQSEISEEDIFYYIYGLLHSHEYRERFKNNLSKQLPRIPAVKKVEDFWAFSKAGRELGGLHVNYESVEPHPVTIAEGDLRLASIDDPESFYRVQKMKHGGKRPDLDKTKVIYNPNITMTNIPLEAYDYVVNGKPALEWVMDRQCVKTDKASGIVNDANRYAIETVGDPAYPLKLFQRVITVSLETMKIVKSLPALDID